MNKLNMVTAYVTDDTDTGVFSHSVMGRLYRRGDRWVIRYEGGSLVFPLKYRRIMVFREDERHLEGREILHFNGMESCLTTNSD